MFAVVGRLATAVLQRKPGIQLAYVDDLRPVSWGEGKFMWLWMLLATYEVLGTPFSYKKVQFVGYELDYYDRSVGISETRASWLRGYIASMKEANFEDWASSPVCSFG